MSFDVIKGEILKDGTIKFVTDPISGPNHKNAEQFLKEVADLAGGTTTRTKRTDKGHVHHHHHEGEHQNQ